MCPFSLLIPNPTSIWEVPFYTLGALLGLLGILALRSEAAAKVTSAPASGWETVEGDLEVEQPGTDDLFSHEATYRWVDGSSKRDSGISENYESRRKGKVD